MHTSQTSSASDDRIRSAALQEAGIYRSRLTALENGDSSTVNLRMQEQVEDLEDRLATAIAERDKKSALLHEVQDRLMSEQEARESLDHRHKQISEHAGITEGSLTETSARLVDTEARLAAAEDRMRQQAEQIVTLESSSSQHKADKEAAHAQLTQTQTERDGHLVAVREVREALSAGTIRSANLESQHQNSQAEVARLKRELQDAKRTIEERILEADHALSRQQELEGLLADAQGETQALRGAMAGHLSTLVESKSRGESNNEHVVRAQADKIAALTGETSSLRKMLNEAGSRVDNAQGTVSQHRKDLHDLQERHTSLAAELREAREKAAADAAGLRRLQSDSTSRDIGYKDKSKALSQALARCAFLQGLLIEHGVVAGDVDADEASGNSPGSSSNGGLARLRQQLSEKDRALADMQEQLSQLNTELSSVKQREDSHAKNLERLQNGGGEGMGARSPTPGGFSLGSGDAKVEALERKMAETEAAHKKKLQQVESDYHTAVHYVK